MSFIDTFWTKTNELAGGAINTLRNTAESIGLGSPIGAATSSGSTGGSTDPALSNRKYTVRIFQNNTVIVGAVPETIEINQAATWSAPWAGGIAGGKGDIMAVGLGTRLVAQVLTLQVWQGGGNNDFDFSIQFELRAYSDANRDVMIPLKALLGMTMPSVSSNGFLQAPGPQLSKEALRAIGSGVAAVTSEVVSTTADAIQSAWKTGTDVAAGRSKMTDASVAAISESGQALVDRVGAATAKAGLTRQGIEASMENKISIEIGDWFRLSNVVITDVRHTIKSQRPGPEAGTIMGADVMVSFRPMFTITREDIDMILGPQLRSRT